MTRVTLGTEPWGLALNTDLNSIEAKADAALSGVAAISDASTGAKGLVELATNAETAAGTDSTRAVTPSGLASVLSTGGVPDASATVKGIVELATTAETTAGTDTVRAVTPAGVAAALAALVNSAPGTLDTLNELAAALGNDPNFATTITSALSGKISSLTYANAAPGTRFTLLYNGTSGFVDPATGSVASVRPSARTNIYFDLVGGGESVSDPVWMINGDAREVTG